MISESAAGDTVRIGHPAGVISLEARVEDGRVERAAFARTARRIMEGCVFVPFDRLRG
jgi:hypothetical protein